MEAITMMIKKQNIKVKHLGEKTNPQHITKLINKYKQI